MLLALFCATLLLPASFATIYYLFLTAIGWQPVAAIQPLDPKSRFAVLIPAHDEEQLLPKALASVNGSDYPAALRQILVIADNCTDRTAEVARRAGAIVIERCDAELRGKGFALAAGLPHALSGKPDAVLVLDADCQLDPAALRVLDAEFRSGAQVVQTTYRLVRANDGPTEFVAAVGAEIENGLQAGLTRLGCPTWLRGTGMAFRREVIESHPWQAYGLVEDVEYAGQLLKGGVSIRFQPAAIIRSQPPHGMNAMSLQRRRWRAALFTGGKSWIHRIVASKPLVLGHLVFTTFFASVSSETWAVIWISLLLLATALVYVRAAHRTGASVTRHVWKVPGVVSRLAWVTAGGLVQRQSEWQRTPRITLD